MVPMGWSVGAAVRWDGFCALLPWSRRDTLHQALQLDVRDLACFRTDPALPPITGVAGGMSP
jgi:hypothetical protein